MIKVKRHGTCTKDCYGACVFNGLWDDEAQEKKFLRAEPLKDHPFTNGFFCPKYSRRQDLLYQSKRIKNALIRNSDKPKNTFKTISSFRAIDIVTKKVKNPDQRSGLFHVKKMLVY